MNRWRLATLLFTVVAAGAAAILLRPVPERTPASDAEMPESYPSDWFGAQRAWPEDAIPQERYRAAVDQVLAEIAIDEAQGLSTAVGPLSWTDAGPYNIGGRVTALAALPGGATVYLGSAAGGVFKSTNSGVNWTPIFDRTGVFSIGALALDPTDPQTIYAGTGEANSSVDSYDGNGVYRSTDGGATWASIGLESTGRIARIAVDPQTPQRLYVAAMGRQFSTGPNRGLYRSEDGGANWNRMLFLNDSVGVSDVVVHPTHPETVYCATWERVRRHTYRRAYGPGSGIWRSADYGTTWTRLQNGLPAPSDSVGRIALAIAPSKPTTLYAQIISGTNLGYVGLGLYRTDNAGANWVRRDAAAPAFRNAFGGFGWYFGDMAVHPTNLSRVYCLGQVLLRTLDGGSSFTDITSSAHVDFHAFWIDPSNPNRVYAGSDGGFFSSLDAGNTWTKSLDLPITQFYAGAIDPAAPARVMGGTQDNGTLLTPGGTNNWIAMGIGGDGFQVVVDPVNGAVFAEYQYCCYGTGPRRSVNGGIHFGSAPSGFNSGDRYNWNTPITMNPLNHNLLLVGSHRVYRSTNNGLNYGAISGDLTTNPGAPLVYGTITTLDISPADTSVYYAGTDDGKVWRSNNRGGAWTDVSAGLPVRYVTRVVAHPADPNQVFVTLSGFGSDEHVPHVYRSVDRGDTWISMPTANLPDVPVNDLIVDPAIPSTLYLATDVGVYWMRRYDPDATTWERLGWGMPVQSVLDLSFHAPTRTLVAATHGRSQWRLDLSQIPVAVEPARTAPRIALSAPRPNPARGTVRFTLELPRASATEIAIYDAAGRHVRTLAREHLPAGSHAFAWDGRDAAGDACRAGVFFARATAGGARTTRRIVRVP